MKLSKFKPLPRAFFKRPTTLVAQNLLNKVLAVADGRSGRIVEVEAYCGSSDPAAHSFRGLTPRNATMFGEPGHLYVYFTYGMHWCANAVAWDKEPGGGVLIRALQPLTGLEAMQSARGGVSERLLCSGPARLAQALGISGADNGRDLLDFGGVCIADDGTPPPIAPTGGPRVGISTGKEHHWRWVVPGSPYTSLPKLTSVRP